MMSRFFDFSNWRLPHFSDSELPDSSWLDNNGSLLVTIGIILVCILIFRKMIKFAALAAFLVTLSYFFF